MLEKLFLTYNYTLDNSSLAQVVLFKNQSLNQFYIIAEYEEQDFLSYDVSEVTQKTTELYADLKASTPSSARNSSLIILVKCTDYFPTQTLLNKIYAVEEDPFGMRKYVIASHSAIIDQLKDIDSKELQDIVLNKDRFDQYQKEGKNNSDHEYMGALQVFIKLPFVKVEESQTKLQTITERVEALMQKDNNLHLREQNLVRNGVFTVREDFLSNAISLKHNALDDWLDETLSGVAK